MRSSKLHLKHWTDYAEDVLNLLLHRAQSNVNMHATNACLSVYRHVGMPWVGEVGGGMQIGNSKGSR